MKEEIIPTAANKWLFILGPALAMTASLMTCAVIPWGSDIELFGRKIALQIADINIGILYVFAVVSMGVYGIMIGGWASNNKFSLMSSLRAASQAISYELAMGLALIALLMTTESLSLKTIVEQQVQGNWWNIVYQPLGFLLFFIAALAECNRTPFDLPEAENELNFGYHQEYSSMKLGFYLFAEYINMIMSSAIMASMVPRPRYRTDRTSTAAAARVPHRTQRTEDRCGMATTRRSPFSSAIEVRHAEQRLRWSRTHRI